MRRSMLRRLGLSLLVVTFSTLFLFACKQSVSGTVFLDENKNNMHDPDETFLGNLNIEATLGGNVIWTGVTDKYDGSFSFPAKEEGTYCIIVKSVETQTPTVDISKKPGQKTLLQSVDDTIDDSVGLEAVGMKAAAKAAALGECNETGDTDDYDCDGLLNNAVNNVGEAADTDDDNDGVIDIDDNCQFKSNQNQADSDNDGIGNACEDDDDDNDIEILQTTQFEEGGGKVCFGKKSFKSMTQNLPIYKSFTLGQISVPDTEVPAFEPFYLEVFHPASCVVKPQILPDMLLLGEACYDGASNVILNLSMQDVVTGSTVPSLSIIEDSINSVIVRMIACPKTIDATSGIETVTITFEATCPDGTELSIPHTIKVYEQAALNFLPSLTTPLNQLVGGAGGTININYTVTNKSNRDINEIEVTISAPPPPLDYSTTVSGNTLMVEDTEMVSSGSDCAKAGTYAICTFSLKAGKSEQLKVRFQKPSDGGEYTVGARYKINDVPPITKLVDKRIGIVVEDPPEPAGP